jgi:four helix bundle protein
MDSRELERRTREFALRVVRFVSALPRRKDADVIGYQLLKAGTSIGANYREANRAESKADFVHKVGVIEKEAAETQYWLELCADLALGAPAERNWLLAESTELLAIFTSSGRTAKAMR